MQIQICSKRIPIKERRVTTMSEIPVNTNPTYWAELDHLRRDCPGKWVIFCGDDLLVQGEGPKFFDHYGHAQEFIRNMNVKDAVARQVPV